MELVVILAVAFVIALITRKKSSRLRIDEELATTILPTVNNDK